MDEKIRKVMSAVFSLQPADIKENSSRDNIVKWDSLKHLQLVVALEQEFGIEFENEEIPQLVSFSRIKDVVGKKL